MRLGPRLPGAAHAVVHPPSGRYGGQSVADRNSARAATQNQMTCAAESDVIATAQVGDTSEDRMPEQGCADLDPPRFKQPE